MNWQNGLFLGEAGVRAGLKSKDVRPELKRGASHQMADFLWQTEGIVKNGMENNFFFLSNSLRYIGMAPWLAQLNCKWLVPCFHLEILVITMLISWNQAKALYYFPSSN